MQLRPQSLPRVALRMLPNESSGIQSLARLSGLRAASIHASAACFASKSHVLLTGMQGWLMLMNANASLGVGSLSQ